MKKFGIALLFVLLANFISAEVVKTINNLSAGTLSTVLTASEKATVTKLIVTGRVDARDFKCMRDEMTLLADVDLAETSISAYNGNEGTASWIQSFNAGEIPAYAFAQNAGAAAKLKTFKFPNFASSIADGAFRFCAGLTNVVMDSCITYVGLDAFEGCTGLMAVKLSDCLHRIRSYAFQNCTSLSGTLTIPDGVQKIGDFAFYGCSNITNLVFGTSVDSLGTEAFNYCTSLKTIRFMGNRKTMFSSGTFTNIASGSVIFVPASSSSSFVNNSSWTVGTTTLYEYRVRVSSQAAIKQSMTSVKFTGSLDFITEFPVLSYGFCWNKNTIPTKADTLVDNGLTTTLGNFSSIVNTLTPGTYYYIRAYATDKFGTVYGKLINYTTPAMPSTAGVISGLSDVCQGQANVTYSVPTINNATTYVWTLPSGASGTSTTNSISVSFAKTAVSGSITVFGRNSNGDGAASSLYITVNSLPNDAGTIAGYSVVCQGESQVNYSVPVIDYATTYVWTLPSGVTGTSTTNMIVVDYRKAMLSGSISVVGKNKWGNGGASTLDVTVHQLPTFVLRDTTLTFGSTLTLQPNVNYTENGPLKYKWTPSSGLSNDTIQNPIITATSTVTYSLTVTTSFGCTVTKDVKISLKAMDKPVIGIVGIVNSKNRIAWNKPVSQGIASYLIYKETIVSDIYDKIGTVPYDSLSVFIDANSVPDNKSSKYRISILDKGGVESPSSDAHKTMHLSINKGQNSSWNLIWEAYEGFKPSTYNIYRGTSLTSLNFLDATSASSTQYTDLDAPTGNVYYQLEVISPNLVSPTKVVGMLRSTMATYNSSRSNVAAGIVNGLDQASAILRIYPNPVKDFLNIEMEGGSTFEIINLTGQVVYKGDMMESTKVNTDSYKPGLYVVKVKIGDGFEFRKMIKE